jgi:hypothetical protein
MRLAPTHSDHTLKQVSINGKAAGESQRPRDQETQIMKVVKLLHVMKSSLKEISKENDYSLVATS